MSQIRFSSHQPDAFSDNLIRVRLMNSALFFEVLDKDSPVGLTLARVREQTLLG